MTPQGPKRQASDINLALTSGNITAKAPVRNQKIFGSIKMNASLIPGNKGPKTSADYRNFHLPNSVVGNQYSSFKVSSKNKMSSIAIGGGETTLGVKNNS